MRQMRCQLLQPASNFKFYQDQLYGCIMSAIVLFAELILKTHYLSSSRNQVSWLITDYLR